MSLIDTIIGVIIVGIIATYFYFVPTTTMQNTNDATKVINYTNLLEKTSHKIEKVEWDNYHTNKEKENKALEIINIVKKEEEKRLGERYEAKGEIVDINGQKFIKIWIRDKKIYQEYFYGI